MDRVRLAAFILLCMFALFLPGCAAGPGFGKAEPDQTPKEIKRPAATETKPANGAKPAKKLRPPENASTPPALTKPLEKPEPPEDSEAPPRPTKPPAIGGSGG